MGFQVWCCWSVPGAGLDAPVGVGASCARAALEQINSVAAMTIAESCFMLMDPFLTLSTTTQAVELLHS